MKRILFELMSVLFTVPVVAQVDQYSLKKTTERFVKNQPAPEGLLEKSAKERLKSNHAEEIAQTPLPVITGTDKLMEKVNKQVKEGKYGSEAAQKAYRDIIRDSLPKSVCKDGDLGLDAVWAFRENLGLDMGRSAKMFFPEGHYDCDGEPCVFFVDKLSMGATGCNDFSFLADMDTLNAENDRLFTGSGLNEDGPWLVEQKCQLTEAGFNSQNQVVMRCECHMKVTDTSNNKHFYKSGDRFLLDLDMNSPLEDAYMGYDHGNGDDYKIVSKFCAKTPESEKTAAYKRSYKAQKDDVKERLAVLQKRADQAEQKRAEESLKLETDFENR